MKSKIITQQACPNLSYGGNSFIGFAVLLGRHLFSPVISVFGIKAVFYLVGQNPLLDCGPRGTAFGLFVVDSLLLTTVSSQLDVKTRKKTPLKTTINTIKRQFCSLTLVSWESLWLLLDSITIAR